MKFDITANLTPGFGTIRLVVGVIIFSVELKELISHSHSFDILTLIICTKQDEGGVCGENYFIGWESIRSAAKLDFGVAIVLSVWQGPTSGIRVIIILVIPPYPSFVKPCLTQ